MMMPLAAGHWPLAFAVHSSRRLRPRSPSARCRLVRWSPPALGRWRRAPRPADVRRAARIGPEQARPDGGDARSNAEKCFGQPIHWWRHCLRSLPCLVRPPGGLDSALDAAPIDQAGIQRQTKVIWRDREYDSRTLVPPGGAHTHIDAAVRTAAGSATAPDATRSCAGGHARSLGVRP